MFHRQKSPLIEGFFDVSLSMKNSFLIHVKQSAEVLAAGSGGKTTQKNINTVKIHFCYAAVIRDARLLLGLLKNKIPTSNFFDIPNHQYYTVN